jgi:hypothetical protein
VLTWLSCDPCVVTLACGITTCCRSAARTPVDEALSGGHQVGPIARKLHMQHVQLHHQSRVSQEIFEYIQQHTAANSDDSINNLAEGAEDEEEVIEEGDEQLGPDAAA